MEIMKKLSLLIFILLSSNALAWDIKYLEAQMALAPQSVFVMPKAESDKTFAEIELIFKVPEGTNAQIDFLPKQLEDNFYRKVQVHFKAGYVSKDNKKFWENEYKKLIELEESTTAANLVNKDLWKQKYTSLFQSYFNKIKSLPNKCARMNDNATSKICCQGTFRVTNNYLVENNQCVFRGNECTQDSNCCSGVCNKASIAEAGVCAPTLKCTRGYQLNEQCSKRGDPCLEGICYKESISSDKYKCQDCKIFGDDVLPQDKCCPGFYKEGLKCLMLRPVDNSTSYINSVKNIFKTLSHNLNPFNSAYAAGPESESTLTDEQQAQIDKGFADCTANHPKVDNIPSPAYEACVVVVDELKASFLATDTVGDSGTEINTKEYAEEYGYPEVTSKTYSDIKKCEFNAFNDSWRDASYELRNAEIFLRGFEFNYSHKGNSDLWYLDFDYQSTESGGKEKYQGNIFEGANKIAQSFRSNRSDYERELVDINKRLGCKCIAIFGPSSFSAEKQAFFENSCIEEAAQLRSELAFKAGQGESKIDGTSIKTVNDAAGEQRQSEAEIEEVDKGAIGLSHQKLLIDYLTFRREALTSKFLDTYKDEMFLEELSKNIDEINFHKVYMDRVENGDVVKLYPEANTVTLYKWGMIKNVSFFTAFLEALTFKMFNMVKFKKPQGVNGFATVADALEAAWHEYEDNPTPIDAQPKFADIVEEPKCIRKLLGVCRKMFFRFERIFVGPRFTNKRSDKYSCDVFSRASTCIKSGYLVKKEDPTEKSTYIIDPTLPLFVDSKHVSLEVMHNYNSSFDEMMNHGSIDALTFLRGDIKVQTGNSKRGVYHTFSYGAGKTWMNTYNPLDIAMDAGYFYPRPKNDGVFQEVTFDDDKINAVIAASKKYAMCDSLAECGAPAGSFKENDIGFKHLFETDEDAQNFAQYVHDIHFQWSRVTTENYMGYPLANLSEYFRMVADSMKTIRKLTANKVQEVNEVLTLYQNNQDQLASEYQSLGDAGVASGSSNITFRKPFYDMFAKLDFNGDVDVKAFESQFAEAKKSGTFNDAELKALNAGLSSAITNKSELTKNSEIADRVGSLSKADQLSLNSSGKGNLNASKPLNTFAVKGFGGSRGSASTPEPAAVASTNSTPSSSSGGGGSDITPFTFKKFDAANRRRSLRAGMKKVAEQAESLGSMDDSGLNRYDMNNILVNSRNNRALLGNDADGIFAKVSKAYQRNYSRVLERSQPVSLAPAPEKVDEKISDQEKQELKELLESGGI